MHELIKKIKKFRQERDWGRYHSPKNLVMALSVEVAELVEHFQWLTPEQSADLDPATRDEVAEEVQVGRVGDVEQQAQRCRRL
mgnify:CR=1 FL=1